MTISIYTLTGYNLKITDMQAACALAQLSRLGKFIQARRDNFQYLLNGLKDLEEYLILPRATPNSDPSWFGFAITLRDDNPSLRRELLAKLDEGKIGTRLLFGGNLINQPYFSGRNYRVYGDLSVTNKVLKSTFWLGVYPGLTYAHLDYVIEQLKNFFESHRKKT